MTAASQRLQLITGIMSPLETEGSDPRWIFGELLANKTIDYFRPLVKQHRLLSFEYNVICTQLMHDFYRDKANEDELTYQIMAALEMAELLTCIFRDYLNVPREVLRLQKEQKIYRELLAKRNFQFSAMVEYQEKQDWISQGIRNFIANSNWLRLFLVRSKRLLETIVPLVNHIPYKQFIKQLDKCIGPVFSCLSWLFFIPRLATNFFLLSKHLIAGSRTEKKLGLSNVANAQLQRRWFEIGNDSAWMTAGLLGYFSWLLGLSAPVIIYINTALYFYDVVLASVRAGHEISQLKNLQAEYKDMELQMLANNASPASLEEIRRFQQDLNDRIVFEQKRLLLPVGNTIALAIAILFCLPSALAFSPILPLIGASLLIVTTIITFSLTQALEAHRPQSSVDKLGSTENSVFSNSKVTFFQPQLPSKSDKPSLDGAPSLSML